MDPLLDRTLDAYGFGNQNPVRFVDPTGMAAEGAPISTGVRINEDGTYTVVNAKDDGNNGIYLVDSNGNYDINTSSHIANSLTPRSFIGDNNKAVVGAKINPKDMSGNDFLNDLMGINEPNIIKYMANAKGHEKYDFKTNGPKGEVNWMKSNIKQDKRGSYTYRGVLFSIEVGNNTDNMIIVASARDIGNFGAGYIAGNNGLDWRTARLGFDGLQSIQDSRLSIEGQTTQQAEKMGHKVGFQKYLNRRANFYKNQASHPLWGPK